MIAPWGKCTGSYARVSLFRLRLGKNESQLLYQLIYATPKVLGKLPIKKVHPQKGPACPFKARTSQSDIRNLLLYNILEEMSGPIKDRLEMAKNTRAPPSPPERTDLFGKDITPRRGKNPASQPTNPGAAGFRSAAAGTA
jgi:hypothetical protein